MEIQTQITDCGQLIANKPSEELLKRLNLMHEQYQVTKKEKDLFQISSKFLYKYFWASYRIFPGLSVDETLDELKQMGPEKRKILAKFLLEESKKQRTLSTFMTCLLIFIPIVGWVILLSQFKKSEYEECSQQLQLQSNQNDYFPEDLFNRINYVALNAINITGPNNIAQSYLM